MAAAAKGKELSTAEKLRQLYELQLMDSEVDELQSVKGELPVEVNDLEDEIAGLSKRIGNAESSAGEFETEIKKQKDNI